MKIASAACAAAALAFTTVEPTHAQSYPVKPVRLIVPYPPGGGTDTLAGVVSQRLSEALGQQVIMDNRPGAGANIGMELAARSTPDGYTLVLATISDAISASLYSRLNYEQRNRVVGENR